MGVAAQQDLYDPRPRCAKTPARRAAPGPGESQTKERIIGAKPIAVVGRKLPPAVEARLARDDRPRLNPDDRLYIGAEPLDLAGDADAILPCHAEHLNAFFAGREPGGRAGRDGPVETGRPDARRRSQFRDSRAEPGFAFAEGFNGNRAPGKVKPDKPL